MELTGKIISVLPAKSGVSQRTGNQWMVQEYVIETGGTYPKKCIFSVFGEDKIKVFDIKVGDTLTISIDIDAREYNGKYYNSIQAYKVDRPQPTQNNEQSIQQTPPPQNNEQSIQQAPPPQPSKEVPNPDDLPF